MMIIGLTGGIASGKSTVAAMLRQSGVPVIDADALSHQLTQKGGQALREIVTEFGSDILTKDLELDRRKLGSIVFGNKNHLVKLEAILHPKIEALRKQLIEELAKQGHQVVVYMAPLIFEKNLHKTLTKTLLITADINLIKNRIKTRDNLSNDEIDNRIQAQLKTTDKIQLADEIIENNGSFDELYTNLSHAWAKLTGHKLPSPNTVL
jgi:dephospho-CoA kinase